MFFLAVALWLQTHMLPSTLGRVALQSSVASARAAADTTSDIDDLDGAGNAGNAGNAGDDAGSGVNVDPVLTREVQVRLTFSPKAVTVGDHFAAIVHAHVPADVVDSLRLPDPPNGEDDDELSSVAPMQRYDTLRGGYVDVTAIYPLAAWAHPGLVEVDLGYLSFGGDRNVEIPVDSINVRSVLPKDVTDPAQAKPKDPRSLLKEPLAVRILRIIQHPQEHKQTVIPFVLALLAAIAGGVWWWRRKRDQGVVPTGDWVEREFQRIEAMRLLEKGEAELHAILMATVLRQYLVRTFATVRESATTREAASMLHAEPLIPAERVLALFERVDLLKFAHAGIQGAEAKSAGTECRGIVNEILDRHQAAVIALEAQRQARTGKKSSNGRQQAA